MKVIEAIGKGFSIAGKNVNMLVILFVFNVIWNIVPIIFGGNLPNAAAVGANPFIIVIGVIFVLLNIFVQGGIFGSLKDIVASDGKFDMAVFAKYGKKFYVRFLGLGSIILAGIALSIAIVSLLFTFAGNANNVVVNILAVSINITLSAVALYYLFLFFLSPYVMVLEDTSIFKAMMSSLRFVRKHLWKAAALTTLLMLIALGIGFIVGVITGFLSFVIKGAAFQVVAGILTGAINAYITIVISAALMVYYLAFSQKKEAEQFSA